MPTTSTTSRNEFEDSGGASKWVLIWVLTIICVINSAVRTSITAVFPLLKADLGFTDVGLGALGSFFLWSYALASPFAGHLADRIDRSRIVLWSLVGWSLVTAVSSFVTAGWQLLAMRALLGIVESLFLPAALALVAEYHSGKTVGTAMSVLVVGQSIGLIGGATFQGLLADYYGWRSSLFVLGLAGLAMAAPTYFLLPRRNSIVPAHSANILDTDARSGASFIEASIHLLKIPSFLIMAAAGALTSIGVWIFTNWLPLYFKETFAMSLATAGLFGTSFVNGSAAVSPVPGGMLSDWVARRGPQYRMLLQAILIFAAGPVLLAFVCTKSLLIIVVALTLNSGLRIAADLNMQPLQCELAGKDRYSIAFGINNMLNFLAGGLGIFVAGLLKASLGLAGIFAGSVVIMILDALMLLGGYRLFLKRDLQNAAVSARAETVSTPC